MRFSVGALVNAHRYVERLLNVCHGCDHINVDAVARSADYSQTVSLRELNHRVIILLARTKPRREIFYGQELPVGGIESIVEFLEKVFQLRLMTQRENKD